MQTKHVVLLLKIIIHISALAPLVWLYYGAFTDTIGADPVERVIHFTGIGAFNILLLTLTLTPLARSFKLPWLLQLRRLIGLYAFTYALLHLANFLAFEVQFNLGLFVDEVIKRPYITVGMAAFLIISALAITSLDAFKKKMGRKWQQLHNFIYLLVLLVGIHFYWSVKSEIIEPSIYLIIALALLWLRRDKIKRWLNR